MQLLLPTTGTPYSRALRALPESESGSAATTSDTFFETAAATRYPADVRAASRSEHG